MFHGFLLVTVTSASDAEKTIIEARLTGMGIAPDNAPNTVTSVRPRLDRLAWIVEGRFTSKPDLTTVAGIIYQPESNVAVTVWGESWSDSRQLAVTYLTANNAAWEPVVE